MKKVNLTVLVIIVALYSALAQTRGGRGIVNVSDNRSIGVAPYDSSVATRKSGDVSVKRVKTKTSSDKAANGYDIYFYKPQNKKLYSYRSTVVSDSAFDKATYEWANDSVVNVTLKNSHTKYKRDITLRHPRTRGGNAAIVTSGK
jgi:hypothetical protein